MNNPEKLLCLSSKLIMLSLDREHNKKEIETVSEELAALQRQMENDRAKHDPVANEEWCGLLKFSNKEILKLHERFRKTFRLQGCIVHARKRSSGKRNVNYELRYRRDGYNIEVSSNDLAKAKQKFIDKVNQLDKFGYLAVKGVPEIFKDFADFYLQKFWKRTVSVKTYKTSLNRYGNHIKPYIGDMRIKAITPLHCQQIIDRLDEKGLGKTCDEVYSIMNMIFKAAMKHGLISVNPLELVVHRSHDKKHGKALTKDEEALLLQSLAGTKYRLLFAVALYTGLRPNEYKTARIEGEFVIAVNSKRKTRKVEYKKIPITPMLRPYVENVKELSFPGVQYMRDKMKAILPTHILYDLRTTFYTRCKECGVADVAVNEFMGHSQGGLADTYTDLSDEYLIREGMKLLY